MDSERNADGRALPLAERKLENSRLLRAEIAQRRAVLKALPEVVTFNNTDICNLRCVMCQRHDAQGRYALDEKVLRLVADELLPTARKAVLTTAGGEPLGPGFRTLVECARRHEARLDVITNAMPMDAERFELMRPLLDHLNVSVDTPVREDYERIRVGASFDRLVDRLEMVAASRRRGGDDMLFSLSGVVMASTLPHLADLVRFAARFGVDGVWLQRLRHEVKATREEEPSLHFTRPEIERHLADAEAAAREVGVNLVATALGRPPVWVRPLREKVPPPLDGVGVCSFLTQTFTVMYTGEVYPCCIPTDYMLGDVRFQGCAVIWNGAPLQRLRRAHYERRGTLFCSGCEFAPHLPGGRLVGVRPPLQRLRRVVGRATTWAGRTWRARWPLRDG